MHYRDTQARPRQPMTRTRRRNTTLEALQRAPEILDRSRPIPTDLERDMEQIANNLAALMLAECDPEFAQRIERGY